MCSLFYFMESQSFNQSSPMADHSQQDSKSHAENLEEEHQYQQHEAISNSLADEEDLEETYLLKEINSALAQQAESEALSTNEQDLIPDEKGSATASDQIDSASKSFDLESSNAKRQPESSHYDSSTNSQPKRQAVGNGKQNSDDENKNDEALALESEKPDALVQHSNSNSPVLSPHEPHTADTNIGSGQNNGDSFSDALMEINDTEQLEFLAQQLKSAATSIATTQPASQSRQQQLKSNAPAQTNAGSGSSYSSYSGVHGNSSVFDKQGSESEYSRSRQHSPVYNNGEPSRSSDNNQNHHDAQAHRSQQPNINYIDTFMGDPITNLRVRSIPILDNLATQILNTLTKPGHLDSLGIATSPETAEGQAFQVLTSLFTQTKTIYSDSEFINAEAIGLYNDHYCRQIIQKANLATFVAALFGVYPMSFYLLDYHFLDVFVHPGSRLLKLQAALYLDLKTQAYIVTVQQRDDPKEMVLNNTFPENIEQVLLARRNTKVLVPSESDFVQRVKRRKEHLAALPADADLSQKYQWLTFLKDIADYVNKNLSVILTGRAQAKTPLSGTKNGVGRPPSKNRNSLSAKNYDDHTSPSSSHTVFDSNKSSILNKSLGLAIESENGEYVASETDYESANVSSHNADEDHANSNTSNVGLHGDSYSGNGIVSSDTVLQTPVPASSIVSASNSAPTAPRTGFFQRRTWTAEEEAALLEGLNIVNGPYWSKILDMYGPGGTVSEVLKDRNQVQLKDKARNLKLYYLKANMPMPEVLQNVTGHTNRGDRSKRGKRGRGGSRGGSRSVNTFPRKVNAAVPTNSAAQNSAQSANASQHNGASSQQSPLYNNQQPAPVQKDYNYSAPQSQSHSVPASSQPPAQTSSTQALSVEATSSQRLHQPQRHSPLSTLSFVASNQLESSKAKSNSTSSNSPSQPAQPVTSSNSASQSQEELPPASPDKSLPGTAGASKEQDVDSVLSEEKSRQSFESENALQRDEPSASKEQLDKGVPKDSVGSSSKSEPSTETAQADKTESKAEYNGSSAGTPVNNNAGPETEDAVISIDSLMEEVGAYISSEEKRESSESPSSPKPGSGFKKGLETGESALESLKPAGSSSADKPESKQNDKHLQEAAEKESEESTFQEPKAREEKPRETGFKSDDVSQEKEQVANDKKPSSQDPKPVAEPSRNGDEEIDVEYETVFRNEAEKLLQNLMDQEKMQDDESSQHFPAQHTDNGFASPHLAKPKSALSASEGKEKKTDKAAALSEANKGSGDKDEEDGEICMDVLEDLVKTVKGLEEGANPDTESEVSKAMREVEEAIRREESL